MKIAIVSELFPPITVGGAEVSAKYLAEALAKKHDVMVVTPNYGKGTEMEKKGSMTVYRYSFPDILHNGQLQNRSGGNPVMALLYYRKIKKALDDFRPDIIHAQNSLSFFPVSLYHTQAKKFATLRDYSSLCDCGFCSLRREFEQHGLLGYLKRKYKWQPSLLRLFFYPLDYLILKMKQYALRRMDGVICVSEFVRDAYSGFITKSRTIHNIGRFSATRKAKKEFPGKVVLYVGKISIGKGTNYFLETIRIVSKKRKDVTFLIVGDGPMKKEVEEFAAKHENVKYMGRLPHERVLELYSMSNVVCSTSFWAEPLSRVPIEALSLGVPCVATDVGGTREIIDDGVNGFLVEPGNPEGMALKIIDLLSSRELRDKFSREGMKKIREMFDENVIVNETTKFYREIMGD